MWLRIDRWLVGWVCVAWRGRETRLAGWLADWRLVGGFCFQWWGVEAFVIGVGEWAVRRFD